jgi:ubiquinone/menaquinone biosynthesis C-methylase UbiE
MMTEIEQYYNKFNEEKRLDSRHGQVEYIVSMKYIHDYLCGDKSKKVLDIGAGTGRYSVALANEGYDVTAVELVKHNLGLLKAKNSSVKAYQGNALKLKRFEDNTFDVTLLFGPMYHLFTFEDKVKALSEAKRVTKQGGVILVAYVMNEYSVLTYGFKEKHIAECMESGRISKDFQCISSPSDLYGYVRLDEIERINEAAGVERIKIISPDGPANYMRPVLNSLTEEEFKYFIDYQLSTCERQDLIGAAAHTVDILKS